MKFLEWMANHLGKFIPLGGPFLGSVKLLRAVMVDGSFEPLDALFDESLEPENPECFDYAAEQLWKPIYN